MPWKETCAMTEKLKFIAACAEGDEKESFAALCRRFGISRKTGYKWLSRYEEGGAAGLEEKERGVREVEHRLSEELVSRVIEARKSHPKWGPKKLRAWLGEHEGVEGLPSASTIGEWLKRYGLVRPRRRRLRVPLNPNALDKCQMPNDVWCIDFKGHFALGDKKRCYPLTLTDAASRYILCCEALLKTDAVAVRPHIERAFLEFGLPRKIRSDNGPPFATVGVGGLSALSVWWIRLGIEPERIEPGHPEQNGRHERMHRTLKDEPASEPGRNLAEQQRLFDLWRAQFNDERPHEALSLRPPASRYSVSGRPYPVEPRSPEYGRDIQVRRVHRQGYVRWQGQELRLTTLIGGEPVGFRELGDELWELFYGPVRLGFVKRQAKGQMLLRPTLDAPPH